MEVPLERVGAGTLATLGLAVAAVLAFEGTHLRPGTRIQVELARIGPLKEGAKVRLSSLVLGRIDAIRLERGPRVLLDVWLDDRYAAYVRQNSDLFVAREGLFGEAFLALAGTRGEPGQPVAEGALLRADDPAPIDKLINEGSRNVDALKAMAADLGPDWSALLAAVDALRSETDALTSPFPAVRRLIDETRALDVPDFGPLSGAAAVVSRGRTELDALAPKLRAAAALAGRLGDATGDPRFRRLSEGLDRLSESAARVERVLAVIDEVTAWVRSGRGNIGALAADPEISDEFRQTRRKIMREPWRVLGTERVKK